MAESESVAPTCSVSVGGILKGSSNVYARAQLKCNGATNVSWQTKMYIKRAGRWEDGGKLGNPNMTRHTKWSKLNSSTWQKHTVTGQDDHCEYLVISDVFYDVPGSDPHRGTGDSSQVNFCD